MMWNNQFQLTLRANMSTSDLINSRSYRKKIIKISFVHLNNCPRDKTEHNWTIFPLSHITSISFVIIREKKYDMENNRHACF